MGQPARKLEVAQGQDATQSLAGQISPDASCQIWTVMQEAIP